MVNSKAKGKAGELQACKVLEAMGIPAHRAQQYSGNNGTADVVSDLAGAHIEVKYQARPNVLAAMEQAAGDCGLKYPLVMSRQTLAMGEKGAKPWLITIRAEDLPFLAEDVMDARRTVE